MVFPIETLDVIACPQCGGDLRYTREQVLLCVDCRLCYPINDGIPDLSADGAMPLTPDGRVVRRETAATFKIVRGKDTGIQFSLERETCKAIGRRLEDQVQTQVFNVDFTMTLDDHTKKLIRNYISKSLRKKRASKDQPEELGTFRRLSDLILTDGGVSRLHAMIFYDDSGAGILDFVSRNGTFVNGREVEACRLKPGDEIQLSDTVIQFIRKK